MADVKPELLALAVCETVIEDKDTRNKSIINIFNELHATQFPVRIDQLTVFAALSNVHGEVQVKFRLTRASDNRELFFAEGKVSSEDPLQVQDIVFRLHGFVIESPGLYLVEIYGAGDLLAARKLQVSALRIEKSS